MKFETYLIIGFFVLGLVIQNPFFDNKEPGAIVLYAILWPVTLGVMVQREINENNNCRE